MMIPSRQLVLLVTVVALVTFTPGHAHHADADNPLWKKFLGWLPEDTETLIVANDSFTVTAPTSKEETSEFHKVVVKLATGPLFGLQDEMFGHALAGQKITCAIEGSRWFTGPKGFGLMPYEGAHIVQFDAASNDLVRKAFQDCHDKAEKKIELANQRVAVFAEKHERDEWTYFVVQPKPGLLICATNQKYLEETLKRMNQPSKKRALPEDLPEWKQVDVKAHAWAIRHFRKDTENDPSSPLREQAAANVPDPAAVGLVFWYGAKSDKVAKVRYLSESAHALAIATKGWDHPTEQLSPKFSQSGPGSVEIVATVTDERTAQMFLFVLLGQLGHGIYL